MPPMNPEKTLAWPADRPRNSATERLEGRGTNGIPSAVLGHKFSQRHI